MFETSKPVPKTEKRCCVFKDNNVVPFLHIEHLSHTGPTLVTHVLLILFSTKCEFNKLFSIIHDQKVLHDL